MRLIISSSFILIISLFIINNVNSFKLSAHEAILSDDDMLNDDNVKTIQSTGKISPTSRINFIGQVGGLDTDINGNLVVFHRGSRRWAWNTFIKGNKFNVDEYPAIKENVVELIDVDNLKHIGTWGANKFYMPHGLTVDFEGNIWLTDVGTHQVYKYNIEKSDDPLLTLGVKFEDGSDEKHFCKPTSVAVSQRNGDIFVSDGYCNNRVVQFDKKGNFIKQFEDNDKPLRVAHSIALIEKLAVVCSVSREEGRIVCFDIKNGDKKYEITDPNMKTVYAIEYDPLNEVLHAVTGENRGVNPGGLTFDARPNTFGVLIQKWQPKNSVLGDAHDLAILPDGSKIYAGQLNGEIDEFSFE